MPGPDTTIVDLIRDFLEAHRRLTAVATSYRSGDLEFGEVRVLVGEGEGSVLYRLKERCHALYRSASPNGDEVGPGALFDLAVGSLFHEAMKFREGYYQLSAYGPKLEALRQSDLREADALATEIEKILEETRLRILDSLAETEILLDFTVGQLLPLLHEHTGDGALSRFLVERSAEVASLTGMTDDALLAALYESVDQARLHAAASFLTSGFYAEAIAVLDGVEAERAALLRSYADGMSAYLERRYADCVTGLASWANGGPIDSGLASLAISALTRAGQLEEREGGLPEAAELAERIRRAEESSVPAR